MPEPKDVNVNSSITTEPNGDVIVDINENPEPKDEPVDDQGVPLKNRIAEFERHKAKMEALQEKIEKANTPTEKGEAINEVEAEKERHKIAKLLQWRVSDETGEIDMEDFDRHARLSGMSAKVAIDPLIKEIATLKQELAEIKFASENKDFVSQRTEIEEFITEHPVLNKLRKDTSKPELYSLAMEMMDKTNKQPSLNQARVINRQNVSSTVSTKPKKSVSISPTAVNAAKAAGIDLKDWAKRMQN